MDATTGTILYLKMKILYIHSFNYKNYDGLITLKIVN
jgi:hypothetical protein